MSKYFPTPEIINLYPGISSKFFSMGDEFDTQILISEVQPEAELPKHYHSEGQFGLVLSGSLDLYSNEQHLRLDALSNGYFIQGGVEHSAKNSSDSPAISIDIKTNINDEKSNYSFLSLEPTVTKQLRTGIEYYFYTTPWFEVMFSRIPSEAYMPKHSHKNQQMGIGVSGSYRMEIGDEASDFQFGSVYFAPPNIDHYGINNTKDIATSLNYFRPPRYNKTRGSQ